MLLLLLLSLGLCSGCGMTTHIFITHRALQKYLQAGSYFPDWGYSCYNQPEAAEAAHWPHLWDHILRNNPSKEMFAFVFGMVSHGVADASWHSLNTDQGFIQYLQQLDTNGQYQTAHDLADFGGEMVLAHSSKLGFLSKVWKWPAKELVTNYKSMGFNVSEFQINACMMVGYLATMGVSLIGKYLMPYYAQFSPQLVQGYRDYFRGGVSDMVNSVVDCWDMLAKSFYNTTNNSNLQFCKYVDLYGTYRHQTSLMLPILSFTDGSEGQNGQEKESWTHRIITLLLEFKSNIIFLLSNLFKRDPCIYSNSLNSITIDSDAIYSQFGKAMVMGDFNGDGKKELAVSAPYFSTRKSIQTGIVYVLKNNLTSGDVNSNAKYSISLNGENGQRFGYSLAVVDLNMDGIDDLAVSAPTKDANSINYLGLVYVFFGSDKGLSRIPNITIKSTKPVKAPHIPGEKWDSQFNILGENLRGIDLDGDGFKDLLIGSPHTTTSPSSFQRGKLCAFYADSRHIDSISEDDADWSLQGLQNYELFGSSIEFSNISSPMLYIGSPGYLEDYNGKDMNQGRIYGYRLDRKNKPELKLTITSNSSFAQFGQSMAMTTFGHDNVLAVASSTEKSLNADPSFVLLPGILLKSNLKGFQAGMVRYINVSSLRGNHSISKLSKSLLGNVYNRHSFGHLGDSVLSATKRSSRLWFTEPMYDRETGRVYALESASFGSKSIQEIADRCYCGKSSLERFGSTIMIDDVDNDGTEDLVVATLSGKHEESGTIHIFHGDN